MGSEALWGWEKSSKGSAMDNRQQCGGKSNTTVCNPTTSIRKKEGENGLTEAGFTNLISEIHIILSVLLLPRQKDDVRWRLPSNRFACLLSSRFVAVTVHCSHPPLRHALLNDTYKTWCFCLTLSLSLSLFTSFWYYVLMQKLLTISLLTVPSCSLRNSVLQ